MRDKTRLKKALREAGATAWEWRAAAILLSVNGIDNALEYVHGVRKRKSRQLILWDEEECSGMCFL